VKPKKKVKSKDITKAGIAELSFFACKELIHEIEVLAKENDGELTDEQLTTLVEAQTQAPEKLFSLCNFLKLMEAHSNTCKDRKKEINATQKRTEGVYERMCAYLATFIEAQGKSYHCGEYELKTRKSSSVKLVDGFDHPLFCKSETLVVVTPDKAAIKEALLAGEEVPGAELVEKLNLSIK
jgi:hypothetical protein